MNAHVGHRYCLIDHEFDCGVDVSVECNKCCSVACTGVIVPETFTGSDLNIANGNYAGFNVHYDRKHRTPIHIEVTHTDVEGMQPYR